MATRRISYQGRTIEGSEIPFHITADGSVQLQLEDGAVLRLRQIIVSVVRTDERNEDGERVYLVESLNQVLLTKPGDGDKEPQ